MRAVGVRADFGIILSQGVANTRIRGIRRVPVPLLNEEAKTARSAKDLEYVILTEASCLAARRG
jgi:hypothetical protein